MAARKTGSHCCYYAICNNYEWYRKVSRRVSRVDNKVNNKE